MAPPTPSMPVYTGANDDRPWTRVAVAIWCLYAAVLIALCVLVRVGTDVWWPATMIGFGPRWTLVAPAAAAPFILTLRRRIWWTIPVVIVAGALLLNPSVGGLFQSGDAPRGDRLRIVTYNLGGGRLDMGSLLEWLADVDPDVVMLQECAGRRFAALQAARAWSFVGDGGLCVASRFPVRRVAAVDRRLLGGWGNLAARYAVEIEGRSISLLNVHLETPREGFEATLAEGTAGLPVLARVGTVRTTESALARRLVENESSAFVIVAGDFNMPEESAIYRRFWSGYANAFSEAGVGLGHTKATRWYGARIDHLLTSDLIAPVACWVGPSVGGDHRPLVAELAFVS